MRRLTFEPGPHVSRIGTLTTKGSIVDLNSAYALLLRAQEEHALYRLRHPVLSWEEAYGSRRPS